MIPWQVTIRVVIPALEGIHLFELQAAALMRLGPIAFCLALEPQAFYFVR